MVDLATQHASKTLIDMGFLSLNIHAFFLLQRPSWPLQAGLTTHVETPNRVFGVAEAIAVTQRDYYYLILHLQQPDSALSHSRLPCVAVHHTRSHTNLKHMLLLPSQPSFPGSILPHRKRWKHPAIAHLWSHSVSVLSVYI